MTRPAARPEAAPDPKATGRRLARAAYLYVRQALCPPARGVNRTDFLRPASPRGGRSIEPSPGRSRPEHSTVLHGQGTATRSVPTPYRPYRARRASSLARAARAVT